VEPRSSHQTRITPRCGGLGWEHERSILTTSFAGGRFGHFLPKRPTSFAWPRSTLVCYADEATETTHKGEMRYASQNYRWLQLLTDLRRVALSLPP
jgi:hypothetical protein